MVRERAIRAFGLHVETITVLRTLIACVYNTCMADAAAVRDKPEEAGPLTSRPLRKRKPKVDSATASVSPKRRHKPAMATAGNRVSSSIPQHACDAIASVGHVAEVNAVPKHTKRRSRGGAKHKAGKSKKESKKLRKKRKKAQRKARRAAVEQGEPAHGAGNV